MLNRAPRKSKPGRPAFASYSATTLEFLLPEVNFFSGSAGKGTVVATASGPAHALKNGWGLYSTFEVFSQPVLSFECSGSWSGKLHSAKTAVKYIDRPLHHQPMAGITFLWFAAGPGETPSAPYSGFYVFEIVLESGMAHILPVPLRIDRGLAPLSLIADEHRGAELLTKVGQLEQEVSPPLPPPMCTASAAFTSTDLFESIAGLARGVS